LAPVKVGHSKTLPFGNEITGVQVLRGHLIELKMGII
jgi:hypothetical protein